MSCPKHIADYQICDADKCHDSDATFSNLTRELNDDVDKEDIVKCDHSKYKWGWVNDGDRGDGTFDFPWRDGHVLKCYKKFESDKSCCAGTTSKPELCRKGFCKNSSKCKKILKKMCNNINNIDTPGCKAYCKNNSCAEEEDTESTNTLTQPPISGGATNNTNVIIGGVIILFSFIFIIILVVMAAKKTKRVLRRR